MIAQLASWVFVIGMIVTCEAIDAATNATSWSERLLVLLLSLAWPVTWAGIMLDLVVVKKLVQLYWRAVRDDGGLPRAKARMR